VENYLPAGRMVDHVYRDNFPKPEAEKAALRRVIVGLGADILALQEMGPLPYLEELRQDLRADGIDYPFVALLEAADADRHVALLARRPWKTLRRHAAVVTGLAAGGGVVKRGVLEATFGVGQEDFTVFVIHLKSRLTETRDDPGSALQRREEARAVRELVLARFPDPGRARFVICGDWNDTRDSEPVRTLSRRGSLALGKILPSADSRGEAWTHHYLHEDSYSRIDFFLVSPGLAPEVYGSSAAIFDGPGVQVASDHRPVLIRLARREQGSARR
ncbi:MAG TPA: endonuclease/exonuclease/phosphatase family protein, partial [Candidatus Didemnitutus sp.]